MTERDEIELDPLLSNPEIAAWLEQLPLSWPELEADGHATAQTEPRG